MEKLKIYRHFLWLTILVTLVGMTACGSKETELPFETIERNDTYSPEEGYDGLEPRMALVTSQNDIRQLDGLISQTALDHLTELNFEQYFAIAVFRGTQATSGYDVIVKRVVRQDNKIIVYVQLWEPSPDYAVFSAATSPYHIIKVRRNGSVSTQVELMLQSQMVTPTPPSR